MVNYIYGFQPVLEILKRCPKKIDIIFIAEGLTNRKKQQLISIARDKGINIKIYPRINLDYLLKNITPKPVHQGVVARLKTFYYAELEEIITTNFLLILDHIQDPQNLGNIIRSACAFGVKGIILPKDRAANITPTVIKVSAGTVFKIKIVQVTNLAQTIDKLKSAGFWIAGTVVKGGKPIWELKTDLRLGLVIGHEHKGISRLIRQKCDFLITIPMMKDVNSLNVATAAAICLYEIFRKRHE
ncbi:MAG: 23S rRNA (guanosine(2251)-2'-O)-methyltransferase RlmB [Candidatus Desulfofervidus auxilii]|nr:23S rRNA (guanosine(2251)-2'-O)-methyltransferase RlmB [Candidatus Desulfofervidus auxilii]